MSEILDGKFEVMEVATDASTLSALQSAEIDQQIATAKRYPRALKASQNTALELATLSRDVAEECIYSLTRDGKLIMGPSARLAEIVEYAWGNCRAGARIVEEQKNFVVAQGVFYDLERNVAITFEVKRRITNRYGKRFSDDMIAVTSTAACSIALRNAVFKGVPKPIWTPIYDAVLKTIRGDQQSIGETRDAAMKALAKFDVTPAEIYKTLGVADISEITLDHIVIMRGFYTSLNTGEATTNQIFRPEKAAAQETVDLKELDEEPTETEADAEAEIEPAETGKTDQKLAESDTGDAELEEKAAEDETESSAEAPETQAETSDETVKTETTESSAEEADTQPDKSATSSKGGKGQSHHSPAPTAKGDKSKGEASGDATPSEPLAEDTDQVEGEKEIPETQTLPPVGELLPGVKGARVFAERIILHLNAAGGYEPALDIFLEFTEQVESIRKTAPDVATSIDAALGQYKEDGGE